MLPDNAVHSAFPFYLSAIFAADRDDFTTATKVHWLDEREWQVRHSFLCGCGASEQQTLGQIEEE